MREGERKRKRVEFNKLMLSLFDFCLYEYLMICRWTNTCSGKALGRLRVWERQQGKSANFDGSKKLIEKHPGKVDNLVMKF